MKQENTSMPPKVTIVTVTRNAGATLRRTIESVLSQDYPSVEYVIVDGASTDDTVAIIESYSNRIAAYVSEKDEGIYHGMEKGIELSTGDMILLMNADDCFTGPSALWSLVSERQAQNVSTPVICYSDFIKEYPSLRMSVIVRAKDDLHRGMGLCHQAMLVDRSVYEKVGGFDRRYRYGADHDWAVRAKLAGVLFFRAQIAPAVIFRHGGVSDTHNWDSRMEGARIIRKSYGRIPYIHFMARQLWISWLRIVARVLRRIVGIRTVQQLQSAYLLWFRGHDPIGESHS